MIPRVFSTLDGLGLGEGATHPEAEVSIKLWMPPTEGIWRLAVVFGLLYLAARTMSRCLDLKLLLRWVTIINYRRVYFNNIFSHWSLPQQLSQTLCSTVISTPTGLTFNVLLRRYSTWCNKSQGPLCWVVRLRRYLPRRARFRNWQRRSTATAIVKCQPCWRWEPPHPFINHPAARRPISKIRSIWQLMECADQGP